MRAAEGAPDPHDAAGRMPQGWLGSLKARMALVLGLVLLLPAAYAVSQAVSVYNTQAARQVETLRRTAALISAYQTDLLGQARLLLEQIATRPELHADPETCSGFLAAELLKSDRFAHLAVTDAEGRVRCASAGSLPGIELGRRPWFQELKSGAGFVLSDVLPSPDPALQRTVVLALPLRQDGRFAGSFSGGLVMSRFVAVPSGIELPEGAVAYLVDRMAQIVTPVDPAAHSLPGWADIVRLIADPQSMVIVDGPSGRMRFVAAPVERDRMHTLVGLPSPLWSWLERDLMLGVIAPVLMLALAVIGIWIATDYLVNRHIHTLAFAARDYARGRHAAWPPLRSAPTELRQLAAVLARTTEELGAREAELTASLAQKEVLLREIHHRVKNNLQVVTSLLNLRAQAAVSPAGRAAMLEAQSRIKALALVHRDLYEGEEVGAVELQSFLGELCNLLEDTVPGRAAEVEVRLSLEPARVGIDRAVPIALFVTEALSNAFKHAFPADRRGTVQVRLSREDGQARLVIEDDGIGLDAEARGPAGLGMTLMRMLAGQTGGRLTVAGEGGTRIELVFPLMGREGGAA